MSKPSCSDCRYECLSWTDYPCSNCCVVVPDGKNMWEPVAPERDVPDIHKRCDNCVHGDMPMSEKPCAEKGVQDGCTVSFTVVKIKVNVFVDID